jgi:hypothetical protein
MRDLPQKRKRCVPTGGFQNRLEAYGGLAADANMWGGKGGKNLTHGEGLS